MRVSFYSFSKRNNSTKTPSGEGLVKDIQLKDITSVTSPVFLVQTFNPVGYNYLYVTDWGRYYYITDCKQVTDMWEITCSEDVLASFKSDITSSSAMVMYHTGSTKKMVDSRIPVRADFVRDHNETEILSNGTQVLYDSAQCAVIGVTGVGTMGQYMLESPLLVNELLDGVDDFTATFTDMLTAAQQLFFGGSAADCLKSAIGLPWVIPEAGLGNWDNIYLGSYPCKDDNGNFIRGRFVKSEAFTYEQDITIPWTYTDWLTVSQYTTITMFLPLIGLVSIPATDVMKDTKLTVTYSVVPASGNFAVKVEGKTSGACVYTGSGSCVFELPFGSTGYNMDKLNSGAAAGIGTAIATAAAAVATGGGGISVAAELAMGGAIAGVAAGTIGALAGTGNGSAGGGGSASLGLGTKIEIWVTQKMLSDPQTNLDDIMGKPYMGKLLLGGISGFCQTDGMQVVSSRAYGTEKDRINTLCNSGIYIE